MALGFEELPADFWDAPADVARAALDEAAAPKRAAAAPPRGPAGPRQGGSERPARPSAAPAPAPSPTATAAEDAGSALEDGVDPPTPLEDAFNQLQSLFPGRVVEVRPVAAEAEAADLAPAPLDDDYPAADGYDDEDDADQDRLSFGPRDD